MPTQATMPGNTAINAIGLVSPTPATSMALDVTAGNLYKWTAGQNATVTATGQQFAGMVLRVVIVNDGTARTITFGSGFKPAATLVGTINKTAVLTFVSDGTNLYESARVTGIT